MTRDDSRRLETRRRIISSRHVAAMSSFAEKWAALLLKESANYDLAAESAVRTRDGVYARFKADSLVQSFTVKDAAKERDTDGEHTRVQRISSAQRRVWQDVTKAYETAKEAAAAILVQIAPPPPPPPLPQPRLTRAAALTAAGIPQLLSLDGTTSQWGFLLSLTHAELCDIEDQIAIAVVRKSHPLDCDRKIDYFTLPSLPLLTERYNAGAAAARYKHKVASISVVTAYPTELMVVPQAWHVDVGLENGISVCIALTSITDKDGPLQFEKGRTGAAEFTGVGPPGTHWMFLQKTVRHRGTPNRGAGARRMLMIEFEPNI